jgi:agmatinase
MHEMRARQFGLQAALRTLPEKVFVTFDVDALDPAVIRATGTPEPGGFTWDEINAVLQEVFTTKTVVGLDVMELCGGDSASAFAAARLTYRMIGWAFRNQ